MQRREPGWSSRKERRRGWRRLLLVAFVALGSGNALAGSAAGYGYWHENYAERDRSDWMSALAHDTKLTMLSLPGTHDSGALFEGVGAEAQTMSISEQLEAGIRAFDIRPGLGTGACLGDEYPDDLWIMHGLSCQRGPRDEGKLSSVLTEIRKFLRDHPSETVLARVKHETQNEEDAYPQPAEWEQRFEAAMATAGFLAESEDPEKVNWYRPQVQPAGVGSPYNPPLSRIRGKLVILDEVTQNRRYGLDYSVFKDQDYFKWGVHQDLGKKWHRIAEHFRASADGGSDTGYINFLSASGGAPSPYFFASGKSSPGTTDPQLWTGWNRGPSAVGDLDCSRHDHCLGETQFPSRDCVEGLCQVYYRGLNDLAADDIPGRGRVGIVYADFPGDDLIVAIISVNRFRGDDTKPRVVSRTVSPPDFVAPGGLKWHSYLAWGEWSWADDHEGASGIFEGPWTCPRVVLTSDRGAGKQLRAFCFDRAGNVGIDPVTVNIDGGPPEARPTPSQADLAGRWHTTDVQVAWNWADIESGPSVDCPSTTTSSGEGADRVIEATCIDNVGRSLPADHQNRPGHTAVARVTVDVDKTKPTITPKPLPAANGFGWFNDDVVASWSCSDATSGVVSDEVRSEPVTGEGAALSASGTCVDRAGLESENVQKPIAIDRTPPTAAAARPEPATSGWYLSDVTVAWNWADSLSGIDPVRCSPSTTSDGEGDEVLVEGSCHDKADNRKVASVEVKVDKTDPVILLADLPAPNSHGWYREDVAIRWSCDDAVSGALRPEDSQTLRTEGVGQTLTGRCQDVAGRSKTHTQPALNLDKTAPVVAFESHPATYSVDQTVRFGCEATDALSGIDRATCPRVEGEAWSFGLGEHRFDAVALDRAGNAARADTAFTVIVTTQSLCALATRWADEYLAKKLCEALAKADEATAKSDTEKRAKELDGFRDLLAKSTEKDERHIPAARAGVLTELSRSL